MFVKRILERPFRLMPVIGCLYIIIMTLLNLFTDFSYGQSVMPFSKTVSLCTQGTAFVLCVLSFIFYNNHFFYFAALEILVFSNLYSGRIYTALFLSSILFILVLIENFFSTRIRLTVCLVSELLKFVLVIPYGAKSFFEYAGITLFSLCTIGCINILFRHAYERKASGSVNLDDYKLSERQKNCIKEIVVNNTTIKALAITHNVSESAIKKDLAHIYSVLGITGKADLKALFIGSQF